MNRFSLIATLSLAATFAACAAHEVAAPDSVTAEASAATTRNIDVAELQRALASGDVRLVDVRTAEEFATGHVPGAQNLPLDGLESSLENLRARGGEIYLVCRSGNRSRVAAELLGSNGIPSVNVVGGTAAWVSAGYPVE